MPDNEQSSSLSSGLSQSELARRFGNVQSSTVKRAWQPDGEPPRPEYFAEWSRKKDPDGLAWEKRGDKFYPIQ